jgi:FtsH-binding integral membrane protein
MPPLVKFILFTLFSVAWGLLLTEIKKKSSDEVIKTALLGVLSIFIIMFLLGLFLLASGIKFDYKVGGILLALLFIIIIATIVLSFMNKYTLYHKSMAIIILVLFSFYIIYDTNTPSSTLLLCDESSHRASWSNRLTVGRNAALTD